MNSLERELKNALRRKDPPPDFTELVMARLQAAPAKKPGWREALRGWFRVSSLRLAAAAALCLALVVGLAEYRAYQRRRRAEGEMARAQVMRALRITSAKLNVALREVRRAEEGSSDGSKPQSKMEHL